MSHFDRSVVLFSAGVSILLMLATWALARQALLRMPRDYLVSDGATPTPRRRVLRTIAGLSLVVLGIALLVLPGPGLLMILLGVGLCDLPGRARVVQGLLSRPTVLRSVNALRARHGLPPLTGA